MSGFVGFVNFNKDISKDKNILEKMNSVICPQKTNNTGYYIDKHVGFYYKDIVSEGTTSIQPLVEEYSLGTYVTMLNGSLPTFSRGVLFWYICNHVKWLLV